MTTMPKAIMVYATEDQRHPALQEEALKTASAAQATLIFYDIDAPDRLGSPRPTAWSADIDEEVVIGGHLMDPNHLEAAGQHELAEQVKRARDAGIEAFGWLPEDQSVDKMVEYADEQGVDVIMVPAELADAGLVDRLRGRTLEKLEEEAHSPVVVVAADGTVEMHGPHPING